jgi:hypothetical protein
MTPEHTTHVRLHEEQAMETKEHPWCLTMDTV